MQLKLTLIILSVFFVRTVMAQNIYKSLPVIKASSGKASYRIGTQKINDSWNISPQIPADSLFVNCIGGNVNFTFYTNLDSISYQVMPGKMYSFYVLLNDNSYALTVIKGVKQNFEKLVFDKVTKNERIQFVYETNNNNPYLQKLKSEYPIDSLVAFKKSDTERALSILHWVHKQWKHNGNNEPNKNDAISILQEAKEGKLFRCVEYGIVATACLNAVGLKARVLCLKTKDVETTQYGAGHVLLEVYLNDIQKWVLLDGQFDAMPVLNGVPLNAVEFQQAITNDYKKLEIISSSGLGKDYYTGWIYPYLFYFDVEFDNREGAIDQPKEIEGKGKLMLVPNGAKKPTIFQIHYPLSDFIYTNSLKDFYAKPI